MAKLMLKPVVEGRMLQALALHADRRSAGDRHRQRLPHRLPAAAWRATCVSLELARRPRRRRPRAAWPHWAWTATCASRPPTRCTYQPTPAFDAICVTGAVDPLPARFAQWLRPGGRMFVVHGRAPAMKAVLVRNDVNGAAHRIVVRDRTSLSRRRRADARIPVLDRYSEPHLASIEGFRMRRPPRPRPRLRPAARSPARTPKTCCRPTSWRARGDPQLSAAESSRLATREGAVQARAPLLPQIDGSASYTQSRSDRPRHPGVRVNRRRSSAPAVRHERPAGSLRREPEPDGFDHCQHHPPAQRRTR